MTGSELTIPVRKNYSGKDDPSFDKLDKSLKRCMQAIEDWADSPFVSSAHIQNAAITNAHIADATIDAAKITNLSADKITSGTLTAEILLASKMRTGDTGERRVEMDNAGVRLLDSSDATVVNLPTDVDQPAYFAGTVVASDLQLSGAATVSDDLTVDVNGGQVRVAAALGNATAAPAVNATGTTITAFASPNFVSGEVFGQPESREGLFYNATTGAYYFTYSYGPHIGDYTYMVKVSTGGTVLDADLHLGTGASLPGGASLWGASTNNLVYVASTNRWYQWRISRMVIHADSSGMPGQGTTHSGYAVNLPTEGGFNMSGRIATDGTDIYVAWPKANGTIDIYKYTPGTISVTLASTLNVNPGAGTSQARTIRDFYVGNGDFGAFRYVIMFNNAGWQTAAAPGHFYVFNSSGTRQTSEEWESVSSGGLTFRDGKFYEMSNTSAQLHELGPAGSGLGTSTYWVAYTWYDNDAGGTGTHESSLSPRTPFTGGGRKNLQITWPTIPDAGGTDDPNSVRLYLKQATSDPGATFANYFRQGTTHTGTTKTLTTYDTSGGTPSQDAAFPNSGSPGQITTGLGSFVVKGDGTLILPKFSSDPGSPTSGQLYYNTTANKLKFYNGTAWETVTSA